MSTFDPARARLVNRLKTAGIYTLLGTAALAIPAVIALMLWEIIQHE